jgi:hypothetical protein
VLAAGDLATAGGGTSKIPTRPNPSNIAIAAPTLAGWGRFCIFTHFLFFPFWLEILEPAAHVDIILFMNVNNITNAPP